MKQNKVVRQFFALFFLVLIHQVFSQHKSSEDFGFKHISINYNKENVDVLVLSKKGESSTPKPLFFFCQGSLPIPLIITDGETTYPTFPFETKSILEKYHLVIVGKPGIPIISDVKMLQADLSFLVSNSETTITEAPKYLPPKMYVKNNHLDFYVQRNLFVINFLLNQQFADKKTLVAAGHSQGARIAVEMALKSKNITHLIYASGNPCGQIMSMVSKSRQIENPMDSLTFAENDFNYYEAIIADSNKIESTDEDSYKSIYSFSKSSINDFPKLKIPTYVCYGSFDPITPFNDYLRAEMIRKRKTNFTFNCYLGLEHNYFGIKPTGEIDYDNFNWDKVANDWLNWLLKNNR